MNQNFSYAARGSFDKTYDKNVWKKYIEENRLYHLTEGTGLDYLLNDDIVEADREDAYWENVYMFHANESGLYKSSEYVLSKIKTVRRFNFLAVIIEPVQDCKEIILEGYDFLGYDLLDLSFQISALTNCGGFDETFLPKDLNSFGLIDNFNDAYSIANRLYENNPEENHANTNVIAIWRHKFIGKQS